MNPDKVQRSKLNTLIDLPNVGKAVAEDLVLLGITQPQDLAGQDAYEMYSPPVQPDRNPTRSLHD